MFTSDTPTLSTNKHLSVSQLNHLAKKTLEQNIGIVHVEGELSNFSCPSSGHWYFTLKDSKAQIRCAMFRNRNMMAQLSPKNGLHVILQGRISLYTPRGDYQLIVDNIQAAGDGKLKLAYDALKQQLQAEGLFNAELKQTLPSTPQHIGVITSATGAAIRDILSVLKRRAPMIPISIFPVRVQGEQAAEEIADAIELANELGDETSPAIDVLIVGRGGGSLEDLWAFNEEVVARAIYNSDLPIVSAVGHESDITISDFVADVRAPTPSAAAELLSPDLSETAQHVANLGATLVRIMQRELHYKREQLTWLSKRIQSPEYVLQQHSQRIDELQARMARHIQFELHQQQNHLTHLQQRITQQRPDKQIQIKRVMLANYKKQLTEKAQQLIQQKQQQLAAQSSLLNSLSPLQTLSRGYSITQQNNKVITSSTDCTIGDTITTRLRDGEIESTVVNIK